MTAPKKPQTFTKVERDKLIQILDESKGQGVLRRGNTLARANNLLKQHGMLWSDVLRVFQPGGEATDWVKTVNIEHVFQTILHKVVGQPREFIESIKSQLDRRGSLSEKQWAAIRTFYFNSLPDDPGQQYDDPYDNYDDDDAEMRDILSDSPF